MNIGIFAVFMLLAFIVGGVIYSANSNPDASDTH